MSTIPLETASNDFDYCLVTSDFREDMALLVLELQEEGWERVGTSYKNGGYHYQTMKKAKQQTPAPEQATPTEYSCEDDSCYRKGKANGEQLFTLRSQDMTMPRTICFWIMENINSCSEDKLRHALEDALRARKWPNRKMPD